MASPEHVFHQPHVLSTRDNKLDNPSPHLSTTEQKQDEIQVNSQIIQPAAIIEQEATKTPQLAGPIDLSFEEERQKSRDIRRTIWQRTGEIPPIAGGSPSHRLEAPIDEDTARKKILEFYTTIYDKKTKGGKKQYRIAVREIAILRRKYPAVYQEVWKSLREEDDD